MAKDTGRDSALKSDMTKLFAYALTAHITMFIIFLLCKIWIMAGFNVFSITMYSTFVLISLKNRNQTVRSTNTIISMIEVSVHQVLAIICLGLDIGFQYFIIMVSVIAILQPKEILDKTHKIIICMAFIIIDISVSIYSLFHEPLYSIPNYIKEFMLISITAAAIFGILWFAYNQWNLSEHYRNRIEELLGERTTKIYRMQDKIVCNFADLVEKRDGSTGGHIKRTSAYVEAIIKALVESGYYTDTLTPEFSEMIISAAPLHDIGKISISDAILCKRGKLTEDEYNVMKTHSVLGSSMLNELLGELESPEYIDMATDISRYHHEKWNGKGYPEGRSGHDIPLSARIMAVADVFDALTSVRVYKDKYSLDEAYSIMEEESGEHFDPIIIKEFIRIRPIITNIYNELNDD